MGGNIGTFFVLGLLVGLINGGLSFGVGLFPSRTCGLS